MHNIKQYIENIHSFCFSIILIKKDKKTIPVIIETNKPINKLKPSNNNSEFISPSFNITAPNNTGIAIKNENFGSKLDPNTEFDSAKI